MNGWKRFFGLDPFDTVVHVGVTLAILVAVRANTNQIDEVIAVGVASAVLFSIRRHFALKRLARGAEVSGETTTGVHRKLETEDRLQELETLYGRVAELEERLDFTERLLATKDEPAKLEGQRG